MLSIDASHLPNLLVALRQQDPDISLVSSSGQVVACHSSILSLLSPSLSSLLAQLPREKAEQLAISLPLEYQDVLKLTDITADNFPKYDMLNNFNNVLCYVEQNAEKEFLNKESLQQQSSSAFTDVNRKKSEEILTQEYLNITKKCALKKLKRYEHKSLNLDDGLTINSKKYSHVSNIAEHKDLKTKINHQTNNGSEFSKENTAEPKAEDKLSNILKEYEYYLESDQPTSETIMLDMSKSKDGNISETTAKLINSKQDVCVSQNENCGSEGATNIKEQLPKRNILQCHQCPYKTEIFSNMKIHTRICNSDNTHMTCEICGKTFKILTGVEQHHRFCGKQNNKNYFCEQCPNSFSRKGALTFHIRRLHTDSKSIECQHCDYKTYSSFNLRLHIEKKHGGQTVGKHMCTICNKGTYSIEQHLNKYHNGHYNTII